MFNLIKIGKVILILVGLFIIVSCCVEMATEKVVAPASVSESFVTHQDEDFSLSCTECHSDVTPDIYADWQGSGHGKMNYGCYICHGDGDVEFYPAASEEGCISCHSNNEAHLARVDYDGCFDCHDGHTLSAN